MRRRAALAPVVALALCAIAPSAAQAWSTARLVSASAAEQAADATGDAVISGDGQHVVFQTTARNLVAQPAPPGQNIGGGIFEKDLATGALALVARGGLFDDADLSNSVTIGATDPSVSFDGRYVSFDTGDGLVPDDTNGVPDVYVRDMTLDATAPGAYTLVSALDGSSAGATIDGASAHTFAGGSISGDGRRVLFTIDGASNLPAGGPLPTSVNDLFVRNLDKRTTTLVSVDRSGKPAGIADKQVLSAVISADGSTVAWGAPNTAVQAPVAIGEFSASGNTPPNAWLWRRVADGAAAVTRRVTGNLDPDDPGCPPGGQPTSPSGPVSGPCDGPVNQLASQLGEDAGATGRNIALSGDGYTLAFLMPKELRGDPDPGPSRGTQAYVSDMRPGVTRKAGLTQLTAPVVDASANPAAATALQSIDISADGRFVAFATDRTRFLNPKFPLIDPLRDGFGAAEIYVLDLERHVIQRVTRGFDGSFADNGSQEPSLSSDGARIAFVSTADNLFFGDGNTQPDAFVSDRVADLSAPIAASLAPPDPAPVDVPLAILRVTARPHRDGSLALTAVVPGPGAVAVSIDAAPHTLRAGAARTVAHATRSASFAGALRVSLRAPKSLRAHLRRRGGLAVKVKVLFTPSALGSLALQRTVATHMVIATPVVKAAR